MVDTENWHCKCNLTELTTRSATCSLGLYLAGQHYCKQPKHFTIMGTKFIAVPPLLLSPFPLTCAVWPMAAFFPLCMGSHGWLTRIWQSREQAPSRSLLLTVEAPGFPRHPTSRSFLVLWMGALNNCVIGPLDISSLFTLASDTHHYTGILIGRGEKSQISQDI